MGADTHAEHMHDKDTHTSYQVLSLCVPDIYDVILRRGTSNIGLRKQISLQIHKSVRA